MKVSNKVKVSSIFHIRNERKLCLRLSHCMLQNSNDTVPSTKTNVLCKVWPDKQYATFRMLVFKTVLPQWHKLMVWGIHRSWPCSELLNSKAYQVICVQMPSLYVQGSSAASSNSVREWSGYRKLNCRHCPTPMPHDAYPIPGVVTDPFPISECGK